MRRVRSTAVLRRRLLEGTLCVFAVGALAACAAPGYNPPRLQSQLEQAGATATQARCVTEGLSEKFDEKQLGSHSAPSLHEYEVTRDILQQCKVTLPLNPLPS